LIEDTEQSGMLTGMFDMCFPEWLKTYTSVIASNRSKNKENYLGDDDHYDAIICLLAVSVKDNPENVQKVLDTRLIPQIVSIIQNSKWEHRRYIPCLKLIACLSNQSEKAAD
jgi:hypothetical protein